MDCLFCKIINGEVPSKKIYEDEYLIGILDLYPNGDGHTLIIPKKHYTDYKEMPDDLILRINKVKQQISDRLVNKLDKKGVTFLVNYLDAQVIKHYHHHIIPGFNQELKFSQDEVYELMKDEKYEI